MSDAAVDLARPIRPVGPSGPPLMPPPSPNPPTSEQFASTLQTLRPMQLPGFEPVERRTMIVGRGVSLSGDIRLCDRLIVGGNLEASIHECRELEVLSSGVFRGNATVATAEIRGSFEGDLVVRSRLVIRSGAHVSGSLTYGDLEIESGAEVAGILMPDKRRSTNFLPPAFATRPLEPSNRSD